MKQSFAVAVSQEEHATRRQRLLSFMKHKKEWAKLNAAYVSATVTSTGTAYASSYIAERCGVDRAHATTWIAGISAFIVGTSAICITWLFTHWKTYSQEPKRFLKDAMKLVRDTFKAQAITWGASWSATSLAVLLGAANPLAVTIQQVVDRMVFLPLYNWFNRKRVHEMQERT